MWTLNNFASLAPIIVSPTMWGQLYKNFQSTLYIYLSFSSRWNVKEFSCHVKDSTPFKLWKSAKFYEIATYYKNSFHTTHRYVNRGLKNIFSLRVCSPANDFIFSSTQNSPLVKHCVRTFFSFSLQFIQTIYIPTVWHSNSIEFQMSLLSLISKRLLFHL